MAYQSPWASLYGSASNPPVGPIAGFLPQPIPSVPHAIENVRERTEARRQTIEETIGWGQRTPSEVKSVRSLQSGQTHYHEAALCSSNFENLAQRITSFLQQHNVQAAAALVHDCAKERWTFGKNQFGRLNQRHLDVVNLLHRVYSFLTANGLTLNGGTCTYSQNYGGANKSFIFENKGHRALITKDGAQPIQGGKRRSKTRGHKKTLRRKNKTLRK